LPLVAFELASLVATVVAVVVVVVDVNADADEVECQRSGFG